LKEPRLFAVPFFVSEAASYEAAFSMP